MASFEDMAIHRLLKGNTELLTDISLEYFSGRNQKIFRLILEYYADNSKLPSVSVIKAIIQSKAPKAHRGVYDATVDAIMLMEPEVGNQELVKELRNSFVLSNIDKEIEALIDAQRNRDAGKAKSILSELLERISINNVHIGSFEDEIEKDDKFCLCPSGLGEDFDELLGGGYSGVTILTAKSGGGKSILLSQAAIASFKEGKNVLFLSLELSSKVLGNRVKAHITGIDFNDINTDNLTVSEKKQIKKAMEKMFKGKKNTWRMSTSAIDTDEILNIIKVEHQLHQTDVVVIDYLALVTPGRRENGEGWVTMANLAKRLHALTKQLGIVIVTASQINEVKKAKDGMEPEITARGSRELEFSSTQFHYVDVNPSTDSEVSTMTFFQIKNRNAKKVHSVVLAEFSVMKVIDTGSRLN